MGYVYLLLNLDDIQVIPAQAGIHLRKNCLCEEE